MQALNNWGLVLQDLASLRPRSERALFLQRSLSKFRQAIRMWPDFDRACYNLGGWQGECMNRVTRNVADQVCGRAGWVVVAAGVVFVAADMAAV